MAPARGCSLLGQLSPGLPGVLAGCPLAVIPGSERRRALLGLTNAMLHVGGDLCCLSCAHLPSAQLAPVSSETANLAFARQMIRCIVCLMQQVYFQTHLYVDFFFCCLRRTIKMGLLQEIASLLTADLWLLANTVLIVYPVQNWYLCTKKCFKSK